MPKKRKKKEEEKGKELPMGLCRQFEKDQGGKVVCGVDEVRGLDEAMDAIEGKLLGEGTTVGARVQDALGHLLRSALSWFGY